MRPVAETPAPPKCRRAVSDNVGRRESSRPQLRRGVLGTTGFVQDAGSRGGSLGSAGGR
jgi:hypothetical protein